MLSWFCAGHTGQLTDVSAHSFMVFHVLGRGCVAARLKGHISQEGEGCAASLHWCGRHKLLQMSILSDILLHEVMHDICDVAVNAMT